jgi:ankyrin repeat protein
MKKSYVCVLVCLFITIVIQAGFADNASLIDAIRRRNEVKLADELRNNYVTDRSALVDGKTALMLAAEEGWRRGVEMILEKRADPNVKGNGGETAVLLAARTNPDAEIIKLLIGHNTNINAKDDMGNTVLMYAVQNDIPVVLNFLLSQPTISLSQTNGNGEDAFIVAARENKQEAISALLRKNVGNFNRVSNDKKTAFMWACDNNNVDLVRMLIESGKVDMYMDLPGQGSQRPLPVLLWAVNTNKSRSAIVEIIDYYTEPLDDIVDREGRNAWYYATLRRNTAVQSLLKQKGISTANAANTQY